MIDGRRAGFESHLFTDPVHLDRDGARLLTLAVGEALKPLLDGQTGAARWVALARPLVTDSTVALEDVDQSRAIVLGPATALKR